jgi:enhancing lycopene biosynthesis protein 2
LIHFYKRSSGDPSSDVLSEDPMSKNVAVVLSGCGVYDGTEVHEASAICVGLSRAGFKAIFYAPDKTMHHEVNHNTVENAETIRNVLTESARIARGKVLPLEDLTVDKAIAVIIPGGFGAAKNLSNFATGGDPLEVEAEVKRVILEFHSAGKPIGLCCIAPILAAVVLGDKGIKITLGSKGSEEDWPYSETIKKATDLGCKVVDCSVDEVCEDSENKIVTTPAYMFNGEFYQIHDGVVRMVERVLNMA